MYEIHWLILGEIESSFFRFGFQSLVNFLCIEKVNEC